VTVPVGPSGTANRFAAGNRPDPELAPVTVAWETTRACPLRCLHCRASAQHQRHPGELTTDEGMALIGQAAEMGTPVFVITGGDPLARPDAFDLIGVAAQSGMHVGFSPSVTLRLTPAALGRVVAAGASTVHLSLDGATATTHDGFRGVRGSFDRTMAAIAAAAELPVRLQVGTTVARQTLGELKQMPALLAGRADVWTLFFLVPTGRASAADVLSADETEEVLQWLVTADLPVRVRTVEAPSYRRVLAQHGRPVPAGVTDGSGFCFVSHTGEVCPSGFLPMAVGNIRQAPLAHWYRDSPLFRDLRDPARRGGKCGRCEYTTICGGSRARAWATTGDPLASDPSCPHQPAEPLA
jgi:AdoMet-dependent heme synthase